MSDKVIRTVVAGLGRIAYSLESDRLRYKPCTHVGAIRAHIRETGTFEFAGFADNQQSHLDDFQAYYGYDGNAVTYTRDFQELLDLSPDLMVISSVTAAHADMLQAGLRANIPYIVVEKPVVQTIPELRRVRSALRNSISKVWVNYERRFHPKYRRLRKDIMRGEFGRVLFYRGLCHAPGSQLYPGERDEGVLLHDTTHLLDLAMFLFGRPVDFLSDTVRDATDQFSVSSQVHRLFLTHENGLTGEISTVSSSPYFHFEIEIMCEKARLRYGNGFRSEEKVIRSKHYENFRSLKSPKFKSDKKKLPLSDNPFYRLYESVIRRSVPGEMLKDALLNVEILNLPAKD